MQVTNPWRVKTAMQNGDENASIEESSFVYKICISTKTWSKNVIGIFVRNESCTDILYLLVNREALGIVLGFHFDYVTLLVIIKSSAFHHMTSAFW